MNPNTTPKVPRPKASRPPHGPFTPAQRILLNREYVVKEGEKPSVAKIDDILRKLIAEDPTCTKDKVKAFYQKQYHHKFKKPLKKINKDAAGAKGSMVGKNRELDDTFGGVGAIQAAAGPGNTQTFSSPYSSPYSGPFTPPSPAPIAPNPLLNVSTPYYGIYNIKFWLGYVKYTYTQTKRPVPEKVTEDVHEPLRMFYPGLDRGFDVPREAYRADSVDIWMEVPADCEYSRQH